MHEALEASMEAVATGRVAEAEVTLEVEADGTQRLDVTVRKEMKPYAPHTIVREESRGDAMP